MDLKNYKRGLKEIQKLLKELPDYPEFVTKEALFHFYLGDDTLALDVAKKAVFLSQMQSQECWQNYGFVMRQRKDYPGALSAYKQALKFSPQ
jgi:tetratricopeptide (TPR) repeat protein